MRLIKNHLSVTFIEAGNSKIKVLADMALAKGLSLSVFLLHPHVVKGSRVLLHKGTNIERH